MKSINPWQGFHLSNLFSYLSLFSSLVGFYLFLQTRNLSFVGMGLAASFVFDAFDGKFAKLFKHRPKLASAIGPHIDTLSDFACFGLLPSLAFVLKYSEFNLSFVLLALAASFFVLASMTRLAVFHEVSLGESSFVGIPTTLAGLILSFIIALDSWLGDTGGSSVVLFCLGALMLAPVSIPRPSTKGLLFLALLSLGLFIANLYLAVSGFGSPVYR